MHSVSIVIPAYNEERRLPQTLDTILAYRPSGPFDLKEIIVVDDGSADATPDVVRAYALRDSRIALLQNPGNRGKGFAVRHGVLAATSDWILFSDADLSAPIEDLKLLMDAVLGARAAIAIGSRALDRSFVGRRQSLVREASGRTFNTVMRLLTRLPFRDTQCGFKLYRRDAAHAIFSRQLLDGFSFDVEALVIARDLHYPIVEVPVHWNNVAGTTVTLLHGAASFLDLMRIHRNRATGKYR